MDRHGRLILRLAVGLYLIYLAYQLFRGQMAGSSDMSGWLAYGAAGVLAVGGAAFCDFALVRYFKERKRDEEKGAERDDDQDA